MIEKIKIFFKKIYDMMCSDYMSDEEYSLILEKELERLDAERRRKNEVSK